MSKLTIVKVYMKLMREAEELTVQCRRAKEQRSKDYPKLYIKSGTAVEKAKEAEKKYREAVMIANGVQQNVYQKDMPALLEKYQAFEEERMTLVQVSLQKLAGNCCGVYKQCADVVQGMCPPADAINIQTDMAQVRVGVFVGC